METVAALRARVAGLPPAVVDAALAGVIAVVHLSYLWAVPAGHPMLAGFLGPDVTSVILALTTSVPLVARRRTPSLVLAIIGLSAVAQAALGIPAQGLGLVVALYSVARYAPRRESLQALGVFAVFTAVSLVLADAVQFAGANALVFLTAWILGDQQRAGRARVEALESTAARLERERDEQARLAAAQEQARIGADVSDLVAHRLSAMLAQAQGAAGLLERDPGRACEALRTVEETGRESLDDLRRLLGVLRRPDGAELAPQPALADVGALVERYRADGLDVSLAVEGRARVLPRFAEVSVYRIVDEALANARRYAGPACVTVSLTFGDRVLEVDVRDDGPGAPATSVSGHGIVGMRERVALLDGTLRAGPHPDGGFEVRAEIPLGVGT